MTGWIVAGVVVIAALAGYAVYLHVLLHRQKQQKTAQPGAVEIQPPVRQGTDTRVDSAKAVYLLADALLARKLTHTEGCLRICALAAQLEDTDRFRREYGVLFRVAEATAHIPVLADWHALSAEQQDSYDKERQAVESRYHEAVIEAAQRIQREFRSV